jgi:hypothetical protein
VSGLPNSGLAVEFTDFTTFQGMWQATSLFQSLFGQATIVSGLPNSRQTVEFADFTPGLSLYMSH